MSKLSKKKFLERLYRDNKQLMYKVSTEMLLAMYSQFAQEESISISKNVRIGVHKRMADGS